MARGQESWALGLMPFKSGWNLCFTLRKRARLDGFVAGACSFGEALPVGILSSADQRFADGSAPYPTCLIA